MRIVVVFPAPFWPTKPVIDPAGMSRSRPSTASRLPNRFVSPRVTTAKLSSVLRPTVDATLPAASAAALTPK